MVIFDQLRVSDDGQRLYINAHVNKASYFDGIYIKKVTVCTEDQVSETNPQSYNDFVYQDIVGAEEDYNCQQLFDKTQVLSERKLLETMLQDGGWQVSFEPLELSELNGLSINFNGKFSAFDTGYTPILVIAAPDFNPLTDSILDSKVIKIIEGSPYEKQGHRVWQFKGKDYISLNTVNLYLYKQISSGVFEYVRLDATDDFEFLHFFYQAYSFVPVVKRKELHLVLTPQMMNEKFTKSTFSKNMFFVYIECAGIVSPDTPCRLDEVTTLGVTFDYGVIFNQAMNYSRELADTCSVPQNFINFILNFDALKLAIETEHYIPAIGYWNNLVGKSGVLGGTKTTTKNCGCHG